jgi:hypothetical protein
MPIGHHLLLLNRIGGRFAVYQMTPGPSWGHEPPSRLLWQHDRMHPDSAAVVESRYLRRGGDDRQFAPVADLGRSLGWQPPRSEYVPMEQ